MSDRVPDGKDREILVQLQDEGRLSNVELAERVALSPSPCLRRVQRLENEGTIAGYRAILSRQAVGFGLTVFVAIKVAHHSRANAAALGEALAAIEAVVACHMVSGEADFLAEIVVRDMGDYERLLNERLLTLPMIADIRSQFALRTLKANAPLPL